MKSNKRGSTLLSESMPEIILAAASVFILIILLVSLIGKYNKEDEIAKGFFEYLEESISLAEKNGKDNYLVYRDYSPTRYFLVYFETNYQDCESFDLYNFFLKKSPKNTICVCPVYEDDENSITCNIKYCKDLKYPIKDFTSAPLDLGSSFDISFDETNLRIKEIKSEIADASKYNTTNIRKKACSDSFTKINKQIPTGRSYSLVTMQDACYSYGSIELEASKGYSEVKLEEGESFSQILSEYLINSKNKCLIENIKRYCECTEPNCEKASKICNSDLKGEQIAVNIINLYGNTKIGCSNIEQIKIGLKGLNYDLKFSYGHYFIL